MARTSVSVACPAQGAGAILNLQDNGVGTSDVDLSADPALAGAVFDIYGCLDQTATINSPNIAPIVKGWVAPPPGTPSLPPNVAGWGMLMMVLRSAGPLSGNLYAGGTLQQNWSTHVLPQPTLPAVGSFRGAPYPMLSTRTRIMLDPAATAQDVVNIYVTESSSANSAAGCTFIRALRGAGDYVDVDAGYIQLQSIALPHATAFRFGPAATDLGPAYVANPGTAPGTVPVRDANGFLPLGGIRVFAQNTTSSTVPDSTSFLALAGWTDVDNAGGGGPGANGWNGLAGTFTVTPETAGYYALAAGAQLSALAFGASSRFIVAIFVNGTEIVRGEVDAQSPAAAVRTANCSIPAFKLNASDVVSVKVSQNSTNGDGTLTNVAAANWFSLHQVDSGT